MRLEAIPWNGNGPVEEETLRRYLEEEGFNVFRWRDEAGPEAGYGGGQLGGWGLEFLWSLSTLRNSTAEDGDLGYWMFVGDRHPQAAPNITRPSHRLGALVSHAPPPAR